MYYWALKCSNEWREIPPVTKGVFVPHGTKRDRVINPTIRKQLNNIPNTSYGNIGHTFVKISLCILKYNILWTSKIWIQEISIAYIYARSQHFNNLIQIGIGFTDCVLDYITAVGGAASNQHWDNVSCSA